MFVYNIFHVVHKRRTETIVIFIARQIELYLRGSQCKAGKNPRRNGKNAYIYVLDVVLIFKERA